MRNKYRYTQGVLFPFTHIKFVSRYVGKSKRKSSRQMFILNKASARLNTYLHLIEFLWLILPCHVYFPYPTVGTDSSSIFTQYYRKL